MARRWDLLAIGLALSVLAGAPHAVAQGKYPERPIRLVLPFPPGGSFDAIGRPWAERMKSLLGTVVVDNQGGGGGSLAAIAVARAQPDGYTLLLGGSPAIGLYTLTRAKPQYNPVADFVAIAVVAVAPYAIAVHPSAPASTLQELVDYAKAHPGKLSYGSAGVGSLNHMTGEMFKLLAGAPGIVHIPYRGAGPAITDAVGGQLPMIVPTVNRQLLELHRAGKLRILAVTSPQRLAAAPDIPTAVEAGVAGLVSQNVIGLVAPTGTSPEIVARISEATHRAMADQDLQNLFTQSGFEPQLDSRPETFRRMISEEIARWTPIVKAMGLRLD
jgi:tripartite-type tricarboxylate transporter receptor subunit TctC